MNLCHIHCDETGGGVTPGVVPPPRLVAVVDGKGAEGGHSPCGTLIHR